MQLGKQLIGFHFHESVPALASLCGELHLHFDNDSPIRPIRCIGFHLGVMLPAMAVRREAVVFVLAQEGEWWNTRQNRQGKKKKRG